MAFVEYMPVLWYDTNYRWFRFKIFGRCHGRHYDARWVARGTSDIHFSFCPTYEKDIRTGTTIDETRTLTTFVAGV